MQTSFNLKTYNTFNIDCVCDKFLKINKEQDLLDFLKTNNDNLLFLGNGSNLLLTKNFKGTVVFSNIKTIEEIKKTKTSIYLKVSSGYNWDDFVKYCVKNNYYGTENLSLIPGKIGGSVVQNIGAYGMELKDIVYNVRCINIQDKKIYTFSNKECEFEYRSSIFKTKLKNYFIIDVVFKLSLKEKYVLSYGSLKNLKNPTLKKIRNNVIKIRKAKLPDPKVLGNAGSFFKNPIISKTKLNKLKKQYPDIPYFETSKGFKIPTAWLLDKAGFKTKKYIKYGVYNNMPSIIVNFKNSTGKEIYHFSETIIKTIKEKYSIRLEREVIII